MKLAAPLLAAFCAALALSTTALATLSPTTPPPSFVVGALCVHDGWVYSTTWKPGARLTYVLFGHRYWRTALKTWSNGEGAWTDSTGNGYEGGYQFTLYTWQSVGGPVTSTGHWAAAASVAEQTLMAYRVYLRDGDSWREWGDTKTACSL